MFYCRILNSESWRSEKLQSWVVTALLNLSFLPFFDGQSCAASKQSLLNVFFFPRGSVSVWLQVKSTSELHPRSWKKFDIFLKGTSAGWTPAVKGNWALTVWLKYHDTNNNTTLLVQPATIYGQTSRWHEGDVFQKKVYIKGLKVCLSLPKVNVLPHLFE